MNMQENSKTDAFARDYQSHFLRSLLIGMSDRKLEKVAMFHFRNSRKLLINWTVEQIAGDNMRMSAFLRNFPLSTFDGFIVNQRLLRSSLLTGRYPNFESKQYAVKRFLGR